jgi:hypothetical protein
VRIEGLNRLTKVNLPKGLDVYCSTTISDLICHQPQMQ